MTSEEKIRNRLRSVSVLYEATRILEADGTLPGTQSDALLAIKATLHWVLGEMPDPPQLDNIDYAEEELAKLKRNGI